MCGDQEEDSGDCGDRILTNKRTVGGELTSRPGDPGDAQVLPHLVPSHCTVKSGHLR